MTKKVFTRPFFLSVLSKNMYNHKKKLYTIKLISLTKKKNQRGKISFSPRHGCFNSLTKKEDAKINLALWFSSFFTS